MKGRVVVTGGREYSDVLTIRVALSTFDPDEVIIVTGAARGADRIAAQQARRLGFTVEEYPAPWDIHGKRAGYLRNLQMLSLDDVVCVLAFPGGPGTAMMLELADERGIPIVPGDG